MRLKYLANFTLPLCLGVAACALEDNPNTGDDDDNGGSSGTSAGTTGKGGATSGAGGSTSVGGSVTAGTGGKAAAGMGGTFSPAGGAAGTGTAGSSSGASAGGTPNTAGTSPGGSAGDTSAGGSQAGGSAGTGGDAGGAGGSVAGTAGASGSGPAGAGGSGGEAPNASGMPFPPGDANVPRPSGTPGNITVKNWAGFKGAVTYSFDDNNSTQIQRYAEMQALGVRYTFYLWTGKSEFSNSVWATAKTDGHELANHTRSHSSNDSGSDTDAATQDLMSRYSVTPYTMAAPNGASVYTGIASSRFMINRGVSNKIIMPNDNTDPFTLNTYIPPTGAGASQFNQQVDSARSGGGWVTMCIHGFSGGSDGAYQPVDFNGWKASVEHAKELGDMWIDTMQNVGSYWRGQKVFSSAMMATAGSDKTWTWSLPDHFPPGKYLRVTVDGGTLKQNGTSIPWDSHGWYEIALDAESVTLSP